MKESGVSVTEIATKLSVSVQFVSQIIHGVKANKRVRSAIAEAIDRPVSELWPTENNKDAS